jgi:hypothetical protein
MNLQLTMPSRTFDSKSGALPIFFIPMFLTCVIWNLACAYGLEYSRKICATEVAKVSDF